MNIVIALVIAAIIMGVLDGIWLGAAAKTLYHNELGSLLRQNPNMVAALIFYVIYLVGLMVFVIVPGLSGGSLAAVAGYGALFGLVAYATYDLTNMATLEAFHWKLVIIDLLWGTFLTTVTAVGAVAAAQWWANR